MLRTIEFFWVKRTRFHVRVSGSVFSDLGKISHKRKDPKKAVQHAAQKTSLLAGSQLLDAILWPSSFIKGNVITNFEICIFLCKEICSWLLSAWNL